jgi:spermidine synthase
MLMEQLVPNATDVVGPRQDADAQRLAAYWVARAKYLAFGMAVRPNPDPRVMLNQLRLPLLEMVTTSPDFRPAAEPLQAMAEAVRETDPELSAQVKSALQTALSALPSPSAVKPLVKLN